MVVQVGIDEVRKWKEESEVPPVFPVWIHL